MIQKAKRDFSPPDKSAIIVPSLLLENPYCLSIDSISASVFIPVYATNSSQTVFFSINSSDKS